MYLDEITIIAEVLDICLRNIQAKAKAKEELKAKAMGRIRTRMYFPKDHL